MARIIVDRSEIARYGINASEVLETVEAIRAGRNVGTVYEGRKRFDLVARFTRCCRQEILNRWPRSQQAGTMAGRSCRLAAGQAGILDRTSPDQS